MNSFELENLVTIRPNDTHRLNLILSDEPVTYTSVEKGQDAEGTFLDQSFTGHVSSDAKQKIAAFALHTYYAGE